MNRFARTARALALASLVALIATALAQGMMHGGTRAPGSTTTPPGSAFGPMGMGYGMHQTSTVDEASFLVHMIPHHREAVASAEALRAITQRPELLALADAIVTSQTAEIASMEGWLDAWHPDAVRDVAYAPMMRDLGAGAAVADVERAFLEDMIGHHMMAVHESQTLLAGGLAEHAEVAALARSIAATQMNEMHQMATWLGAWYDADASTPMGMGRYGATGYGPMGYGGAGAPGTMMPGMGGYGYGARGSMADHHRGAYGGAAGTTIGAAQAERLALAFLAGRGVPADAAEVASVAVSYEVVVRVDGEEQVLRVDAGTGEVTVVPVR